MLIRAVTINDVQTWLNLAHESDELVSKLTSDISTFYEGFDDYMADKIRQNEAFMATDRMSGRCLGIVAFSKTNNRITFLGIAQNADFQAIGSKLIGIALNQLDPTKEISTSVFKSDLASVKQEQTLYESYGFIKHDNTILEAGVPAYLMKKPPSGKKEIYSFHHNYAEYIEWMEGNKCPFCNNESFDHVLIKELDNSFLYASVKAQGLLWGKCFILCKKHYVELYEMSPQDLSDFMADVQKAAKALKEVSGAVKINLELHGNSVPHLHIHLFPRYLDDLFAGKAIDYTKTEPSPYESKAEFEYFVEQMRLKLDG